MTWRQLHARMEREPGLKVYRKGTGAVVTNLRWFSTCPGDVSDRLLFVHLNGHPGLVWADEDAKVIIAEPGQDPKSIWN